MSEGSVLVVLRRSPFADDREEEGLRVAVGLTLANPEVGVLLLDAAARLVAPLPPGAHGRPDLLKHWQTLGELGSRRVVERESLMALGLARAQSEAGVEIVARNEVAELLAAAGAVVVY